MKLPGQLESTPIGIESTPIGEGWEILKYTDRSKEVIYFARHGCVTPGNRPWMVVSQRVCHECGDSVPNHIQALMTLITWDTK